MSTDKFDDKELIERYLEGDLDNEELSAFHKRMQEDEEFAAAVRLEQNLPSYWRGARQYEQVRSEVRRALQSPAHRGVFTLNRTTWAIAASIVIIAGLALTFLLISRPAVDPDRFASDEDTLLMPSLEQPEHKATIEEVVLEKVSSGGSTVELIRPLQDATFSTGEEIIFEWNHDPEIALELKVFDVTSGTFIYTTTIMGQQSTDTIPGKVLHPGRYFWYLGDKAKKRSFTVRKD